MIASGSSGVSQRSTSSKSALVTRPAVGMPGTWMRVGTRVATSKTWYFAHSPCSPLPTPHAAPSALPKRERRTDGEMTHSAQPWSAVGQRRCVSPEPKFLRPPERSALTADEGHDRVVRHARGLHARDHPTHQAVRVGNRRQVRPPHLPRETVRHPAVWERDRKRRHVVSRTHCAPTAAFDASDSTSLSRNRALEAYRRPRAERQRSRGPRRARVRPLRPGRG